MKTKILTHLLTLVMGGIIVIIWSEQSSKQNYAENIEFVDGAVSVQTKHKQSVLTQPDFEENQNVSVADGNNQPIEYPIEKDRIHEELKESIPEDKLHRWLEQRQEDPEANAVVGMLLNDPLLIRSAIELDPDNPHLQYLGFGFGELNQAEKLIHAERLYSLNAENSLAGFLYASQLLKAGDHDSAIEILRDSLSKRDFETYNNMTILMIRDALVENGASPITAKLKAIQGMSLPHLGEISSMVDNLNKMSETLPLSEQAYLRKLTAATGMRIADEPSGLTNVSQLSSLALEEKSLKSLEDDEVSPYDGLLVREVRKQIDRQRNGIDKVMKEFFDLNWDSGVISEDPVFQSQFIDRFMLFGELEAQKWALQNFERKK